jgi:chromosome segregation ATPase
VKLDDQFYVRPLRDYEYLFHEYERRDTLLNREASEIAAATASVTESKGRVDAQIKIRGDQQAKLAADASSFTTDLDTITAERKQLEVARQGQLNELRGLYQRINEQVAQLTKLQRDLAAEVQKRAAMVSTGGE